jgi:tRNA threonylcarbamoyladenosine biosynthesis protein TsaB
MMLAVDTSTDQMGIALGDGYQIVAESMWRSQQYHTVELAPAIAELLRRAGISMTSIEAVSVAVGPGSYTALRVGLALAKGIALSRNLPLVGIPTLDVLAAGQPVCALRLGAVIRAGRGRIALGWYKSSSSPSRNRLEGEDPAPSDWQAEGPAEVTTVDALAKSIERPTLIAGELTTEERQRLARKKKNVVLAPAHLCLRRPSLLAEIGWARYQSGQVDDRAALTPIYLHHTEPLGE